MANKSLFPAAQGTSTTQTPYPKTNTVNAAGGVAYQYTPLHELAQFVGTGVLRDTFYLKAEDQLKTFMELTKDPSGITDEQLAKVAIWGRNSAFMKDTPVLCLMRILSRNNMPLFHKLFNRVIDNGRQIRNAFQMLRSGQFGRRGMGYSVQRAFSNWFNSVPPHVLIAGTIGNDPSLRDVLRATRPTPKDKERDALFAWIAGKDKWQQHIYYPQQLKDILAFRAAKTAEEQVQILSRNERLRWDMLADAVKSQEVWTAIARTMGHQALRMNLNTLNRHEVLKSSEMVNYVAGRLGAPEEIRKARQWPVQYFSAYMNADDVPHKIRMALSAAAEIACGNVPEIDGPLIIGVDTSGSMSCPITGYGTRAGQAQSKVTCRDAAALFGAAILRKNPDSLVVPFDTSVHMLKMDAGDTILSISQKLSRLGGGGTDCSLPLAYANKLNRDFAGCVMISDNESWVGTGKYGSSGVMSEWETFRKRMQQRGVYKDPKLLNIDLTVGHSSQTINRRDIMNVGGFSDSVFNMISGWMFDKAGQFTEQIEAISLD